MSVAPAPSAPVSAAMPAAVRQHWPVAVAWGALGLLLAANVPAFLCMALDADISFYDLVARRILRGDTHYRDLLDTNLPGMPWLHMLVRSVVGWRSESLRAVDLLVVAASVWLLVRWLPRGTPAWGRVATAGVLLAFYLSTSEWCHCQRDVWMLLPCLVALRLRAVQSERLTQGDSAARLVGWGFVEGAVWGVGVWIKPFVVVPALACWLVSVVPACGSRGAGRRVIADLTGLLAGGLAVGAAGVGWLVATGAWATFLDVLFVWNREYFAFNVIIGPWWNGPLGLATRFFPWVFVHVIAVPLAVVSLRPRNRGTAPVPPLLAAFYLGWLLQAVALQHLFDYVHAPAVLLALAVTAAYGFSRIHAGGRSALVLLLMCVLLSHPQLIAQRKAAWSACLADGSTPAVRDRVGLLRRVYWADLDRVAAFLRDQQLGDGELTCFSLSMLPLYNDLDLKPSTRYLLLQENLNTFVSRRPVILAELVSSRQRFVVCDLVRDDMQQLREAVDGGRLAARVAFRAGEYIVLRVDGSEMPGWLDAHFSQ